MLWNLLVCSDGVPRASGEFQIVNGSNLDLEEELKQLDCWCDRTYAKKGPQVRARGCEELVAEAENAWAGQAPRVRKIIHRVRSRRREEIHRRCEEYYRGCEEITAGVKTPRQ